MLSTSNRFKQSILLPPWKTPNFFFISSSFFFFSNNLCTCRSFNHGERSSSFSPIQLHSSIPHFLTTGFSKIHIQLNPVKLLWLNYRPLVTQSSTEEDYEVANQELAEIISNLKKNPNFVKKLCVNHIDKLCRNKTLRAARKLLQLLREKHSVFVLEAYNLVLMSACEDHNTEIALGVFKDMLRNNLLMNSATFFYIAKSISKSNDFTLVLTFIKEISSVTILNRIIYAFAECGHVHNAIFVFDNMKSLKCKPDLFTYNTVLGILGKAGKTKEMLEVFASMKKDEIAPDVVSYNTVVNSLRKVGRFDLCVVVMKEMRNVGLPMELITYTALIECYFKSGNVEESLELFEEMKKGHIQPSIYVYRSLISNLERLGKSELALKFLKEMNECREDLVGPKDFKRKNR